jgi:hypothetical protein
VFETPSPSSVSIHGSTPANTRSNNGAAGLGGTDGSAEEEEDVAASLLKINNTLLGAAVTQRQARFVADVGQYMQVGGARRGMHGAARDAWRGAGRGGPRVCACSLPSRGSAPRFQRSRSPAAPPPRRPLRAAPQSCPRPARDIFSRASRIVSSVVVLPLVAGDADDAPPLGGLYFALDAPCEFSNVQDVLLGFIHGVTPLLDARLSGRADDMAGLVGNSAARRALALSGSSAVLDVSAAPRAARSALGAVAGWRAAARKRGLS